jgi:hypothetical protein
MVKDDEPGALSVLGPQKLTHFLVKFCDFFYFLLSTLERLYFYYLLRSALSFHSNKGSGIPLFVFTLIGQEPLLSLPGNREKAVTTLTSFPLIKFLK